MAIDGSTRLATAGAVPLVGAFGKLSETRRMSSSCTRGKKECKARIAAWTEQELDLEHEDRMNIYWTSLERNFGETPAYTLPFAPHWTLPSAPHWIILSAHYYTLH